MREMRRKMRVIGTLIIAAFIGLSSWFAVTVWDQGSIWASSAYNSRLRKTNSQMGSITDRNGNLLATTNESGQRIYLQDVKARRALSQVVGDTAGMSGTGVETFYSATLLDLSGSLIDRLRELLTGAEHKGSSIQLTVDAELSAYIASIFPAGYNGAVCVTNYKTGELLAMVSLPNYDPVEIERGELEGTQDTAFLNRCLQGLYTPGSVFKLVTLASALENDPNVVNQTFTCAAKWDYGEGSVNCMSGRVSHGTLSLKSALARSCNVTFGKLAYQLGATRLGATAEAMGFNENFKFGEFVIYNSSFPTGTASMNELVWSGIGQGTVLVTPLHMNMITGAIANGGVMMKPKLIRQITSTLGIPESSFQAETFRRVMSAGTAATISGYMREAVNSGTATRAALDGLTVCGKTGSAETSDDKGVPTNAWYTGYIADERYPYAISVVIEKGGAGGQSAAELAAKALKKTVMLVR